MILDNAQHIIAAVAGCLGHELQRCIEQDHHDTQA
jgi:hypothetical protein